MNAADLFRINKIGKHIQIDSTVRVINPEFTKIDNYSRIDMGCFLSGSITIGRHVHISPYCTLSGIEGIDIDDFVTISGNVKFYTISANYKDGLTNPTIPEDFRSSYRGGIKIGRHVCIFGNCTILPNTTIEDGAVILPNSTVHGIVKAWRVYYWDGKELQVKSGRDKDKILEAEKKLREFEKW